MSTRSAVLDTRGLRWASEKNIVEAVLARRAGVFEPSFGLVLRPEIAAISMSGSSFLVATNAVLLKRLRLPAAVETRQPDSAPPPEEEKAEEARVA